MIRIYLQKGAPTRRASTRSTPCSSTTPTPRSRVAELMRLLVDEHGMEWERRPGRSPGRPFAYTNHTLLPGGAREVAGRPLRRRPAAPPRDHLRDQPPLPRRGARAATPATTRRVAPALASSTRPAAGPCAWPTSPASAATRINGVAALHTELLKTGGAARLPRAVAREVHQRDERRHAAPLRRARATRGSPTSSPEAIGDALAPRPRASSAGSSRSPRTPRFRERWRAGQARQQGGPRRGCVQARTGVVVRPRQRSSTSR